MPPRQFLKMRITQLQYSLNLRGYLQSARPTSLERVEQQLSMVDNSPGLNTWFRQPSCFGLPLHFISSAVCHNNTMYPLVTTDTL
jgi:hypothetical protein